MTTYKRSVEYDNKIEESLNQFRITSIIKENNIHISGSFVLNIIKETKKNTSDLDLYVNIKNLSEKKLGDMILNLILKGYYIKTSNFDKIKFLGTLNKENVIDYNENYDKFITILKRCYNQNDLTKGNNTPIYRIVEKIVKLIYKSINNNNNNNDYDYFSLKEYLSCIIKFYNPKLNKEIDLMILKSDCNIKKMITNTFDFDIIKNFISFKLNKFILYYLNKDIKTTDKATISVKHFTDRIATNIHEFNNFITRYHKYRYNKNYNIYIGKQLITQNWMNKLINIIYMNINIDFIKINSIINRYGHKTCPPRDNQYYRYIEFSQLTLPDIQSNDAKDLFITISMYNYNEIKKQDIQIPITNMRICINENLLVKQFKSLNCFNIIIGHLLSNEINIITNELIKNSEFSDILNTYKLIPIKTSTDGESIFYKAINIQNNSCCICLEENVKLFDIYCGNTHKLCGECLLRLVRENSSSCPLCRRQMFN